MYTRVTNDSMEVVDDQTAKPVKAEAFSSDLAAAQRIAVLERFKGQEVDVCVTSLPCSHRVIERKAS